MILWIDDEAGNLTEYAELIRFENHEVVFAHNPFEAIDIITRKHDQIILVILDIIMPLSLNLDFLKIPDERVTGLYLGEYISRNYPGIPIVIFSIIPASMLTGIKKRVLKIITKPDYKELINTIKAIDAFYAGNV